MSQKLTPWFPGRIKPVRKGVYMQMCGFNELTGYQYWNGEFWGLWCETPKDARARQTRAEGGQNDKWRGVMK